VHRQRLRRLRRLRDPHFPFLSAMTNARSRSDLKELSFSESERQKLRPGPNGKLAMSATPEHRAHPIADIRCVQERGLPHVRSTGRAAVADVELRVGGGSSRWLERGASLNFGQARDTATRAPPGRWAPASQPSTIMMRPRGPSKMRATTLPVIATLRMVKKTR
jgi:hypothetical protein